MRILKTLIFILICFTSYGQGIEPIQLQDNPYQDGILRATDRIWSDWLQDSINQYVHAPFPLSIDSVKYENDSLYIFTPDSMYVVEILAGGGGTLDGVGIANKVALWADTDSLTYDSLYFNPTNHILGLGTDSPTATGSSFGFQIHGGSFSSLRLTNTTTGAGSTAGTSIYTYADSLYLSNLENGIVSIGTNSSERVRFDSDGVLIPRLDSDNASPTMSGTTKKLIVDDKGRLGTATNNTGTVTSVAASTGTSGTDFNISGSPITSSGTITFNLPTASASNRGALSTSDWSTFNSKVGGSGTTNQFAYFSGSNTLTSSSVFSFNTHGVTLQKGTWNTFINGGNNTLSGTANISVGSNTTMAALTSGSNNVSLGNAAGQSLTTGSGNFNLGYLAGASNSTSSNNVFLGSEAGYQITGEHNCFIGSNAGRDGTATSYTVGIGTLAGYSGGSSNVDIGYYSGFNSTGSYNVRLGRQAGQQASSSNGNIYIGYAAGQTNTGSNNTVLGYAAGLTGDGSTNIFLGYNAGYSETGSNTLHICNSNTTSNGIYGNFATGRFGINTAPASLARALHVTGEMRVTDLTTDTPTQIIGADSDGDIGAMTVGNGVTVSSGQVGLTGQALAVHNLGTNGIIARTSSGNVSARTITAGDGIAVTNGDGISGNPTITNTGDLSTTNELQTLSWSSPNLSISSGNSVALPVLPAGTSTNTLAYLSGAWTSSAFLKNNSSTTTTGNLKRVSINDDVGGESWPLTLHTATKFLVNGRVQMNSTASTSVTSIMGRNADMEVGTTTIGANMELTSGTLQQKQVLGLLSRSSSSSLFSTSSTPVKLDFSTNPIQLNATANTTNDDIVTTVSNYGAYEIKCDCQFNSGATATYNFGIYVNGTLNGSLVKQIPMTSGNTHDVIIYGWVSTLTTTDEVDIRVSTSTGTTGNTIGRCNLALTGL